MMKTTYTIFLCFVTLLLQAQVLEPYRAAEVKNVIQVVSVEEASKAPSKEETEKYEKIERSQELSDDAWILYRKNDFQAALDSINKAIELYPDFEEACVFKCYIMIKLTGDDQDLIDFATQCIERYPQNYDLYDIRGTAYEKTSRPDKALADYETLIKIHKTDVRCFNNYMTVLNRMRADDKMLELYSIYKAQLLEGRHMTNVDFSGDVNFYAALAMQRKGNIQEAANLLTKALEYDDDNNAHPYYNNRGICYRILGKYELSLSDLNRAVEIAGDTEPTYFSNRGFTYMFLGKYEQAKNDFLKAISLNNTSWVIYSALGNAYQMLDNYKMAKVYYEILLKDGCRDRILLDNYAYCLFEENEINEAIEYFQAVYKSFPTDIDALVGLAACYTLQGNRAESQRYLQEIKNNTDYEPDADLLEELMKGEYAYSEKFQETWKSMFN